MASLCVQEGGVDLARLTAVDVHVHVEADHDGRTSLPEDVSAASSAYFGVSPHRPTVDEIAAYYRERRIGAVVFTVDIEAFTGHPALSNEQIAEAAARHSDVLIPFASIDPAKGRTGARQLRRLAGQHGVRGVKFHPSIQGFAPNDGSAYPLLEVAQDLGLPPQLVRYANSLLQDKVMFGSDYPLITPDRWLADFGNLDIKPQVRPKILKDNAVRVLK